MRSGAGFAAASLTGKGNDVAAIPKQSLLPTEVSVPLTIPIKLPGLPDNASQSLRRLLEHRKHHIFRVFQAFGYINIQLLAFNDVNVHRIVPLFF